MSDKKLTPEDLVAMMDAQVAESRETGARVGGNTVEPGVYPDPAPANNDPEPEVVTNEDTAEVVAAMDAQVAAAHGGAAVAMTSGVEISTPVDAKAPARAKTK